MRKTLSAVLVLMATIMLVGCAVQQSAEKVPSVPTATPCIDNPDLTSAVGTLLGATDSASGVKVYGAAGGRTNDLVSSSMRTDFAAMQNPKGIGVIVSIVYGSGKAFARDTATRAGWLVIDKTVYPIDVDAAQAFGLLLNGYPESVLIAAGLGADHFGMKAYGLDNFVSYNADTNADFLRFVSETNQLCKAPTLRGE